MELPEISIPQIPLPIEIAEYLHPAVVHFAIVLPIVILLLEVYNLGVKRRSISVFSLFLVLLVAVIFAASYLTGTVDGKAATDALSLGGKTELKEHKLIGIYLTYASLGLVLFKLLFMVIRKVWGKIFFILILSGFILGTLYQGKEGGDLVYKHGANVKVVNDLKSSASEVKDSESKLKENLESLKSKNSELEKKNQKVTEELSKMEKLKKEADEALEKAKKEADSALSKANSATTLAVKNVKEVGSSALERAKEVIATVTAKVVAVTDGNDTNTSK